MFLCFIIWISRQNLSWVTSVVSTWNTIVLLKRQRKTMFQTCICLVLIALLTSSSSRRPLWCLFSHNNNGLINMSRWCFWTTSGVMSLPKFSGDNLAVDLMKPEVWRKTFTFLPIMELVKLRQVCLTFRDEVDFLFGVQENLGIFESKKYPVDIQLCEDPGHEVPNSSWIWLDNFVYHLSTLKSLFPSVKVLVINAAMFRFHVDYTIHYIINIEQILDTFVNLECLAINDRIVCSDTDRNLPNLKHLSVHELIGKDLFFMPSLESLHVRCDIYTLNIKSWLEINGGRPSKRFEIGYFTKSESIESFQCLSSLPSSLEYLKTGDFFGYSRRFEPMFTRLKEVDRLRQHSHQNEDDDDHIDFGNTEFISFLKDHRLTLKKVSTHLEGINDEQLEEMLSCLEPGTVVTLHPWLHLKNMEYVRLFSVLGRLCRDHNLVLNITWDFTLVKVTLEKFLQLLDMLPPETYSLKMHVVESISTTETSCQTLVERIVASPLISTILEIEEITEEVKRSWSSVIQGLPETHEAILDWFEPKYDSVVIRRRNWILDEQTFQKLSKSFLYSWVFLTSSLTKNVGIGGIFFACYEC